MKRIDLGYNSTKLYQQTRNIEHNVADVTGTWVRSVIHVWSVLMESFERMNTNDIDIWDE